MPDSPDPLALMQPLYRFEVRWEAPWGQVFSGRFAHKAPSVNDTLAIGAAYARRKAEAGGDLGEASELAGALCHLEVTLVERPDWAKDLGDLPHPNLLGAVFREVMPHIDTFCLGGKAPPPG